MTVPRTKARRRRARILLRVPRYLQHDDVSCGPTALMQVFHYWGDRRPFEAIASGVIRNDDGGTLAVHLGVAALEQGYRARLCSWNLQIFDPTWAGLSRAALQAKLAARSAHVTSPKVRRAIRAYDRFLDLGGHVVLPDLDEELLVRSLSKGRPVVTGLSATYLYRQARERPLDNRADDVGGQAAGHFVVVSGYDPRTERFAIRDPFPEPSLGRTGRYTIPSRRLLNAILLGHETHDAVLLETWPRRGVRTRP